MKQRSVNGQTQVNEGEGLQRTLLNHQHLCTKVGPILTLCLRLLLVHSQWAHSLYRELHHFNQVHCMIENMNAEDDDQQLDVGFIGKLYSYLLSPMKRYGYLQQKLLLCDNYVLWQRADFSLQCKINLCWDKSCE